MLLNFQYTPIDLKNSENRNTSALSANPPPTVLPKARVTSKKTETGYDPIQKAPEVPDSQKRQDA
jgi:O6-methylguanine-DNA--protein-cysteine methyltransferase